MAVPGKQPDAIGIAVNGQAEAVILDLVKPVGTGRDSGPTGRDGGLKTHDAKICVPERYFECIGRAYPQGGAKMRSR
jgi:hypothetical protein